MTRPLRSAALVGVLLPAVLLGGCLYMIPTRTDLVYEKSGSATGGFGEIFVAKPEHHLSRDPEGWTIIGSNGPGAKPILTQSDVSDWVAGALIQELSAAGYKPTAVTALPQGAPKGVTTNISRMWVTHEVTGWGAAAPSSLELEIRVVRGGVSVANLKVAAKGDFSSNFPTSMARQKAFSLQKALQEALAQAVPEIIKNLEPARGQ